MGFKTPDGKEFETKKEWKKYMYQNFYSFSNKVNEAEAPRADVRLDDALSGGADWSAAFGEEGVLLERDERGWIVATVASDSQWLSFGLGRGGDGPGPFWSSSRAAGASVLRTLSPSNESTSAEANGSGDTRRESSFSGRHAGAS